MAFHKSTPLVMISKSAMPGDAGQESEESELQNLGFFSGLVRKIVDLDLVMSGFFEKKNSSW